jgi:hypothetical protein
MVCQEAILCLAGNAAEKPVLPLPSRSETRIRIQRAFRGLLARVWISQAREYQVALKFQ